MESPHIAQSPRLILASASPQRQRLLREAGFQFLIYPSGFDEESLGTNLPPAELAVRLAIAKAQAVAPLFPNDVVLAADTVVALGLRIFGKPIDAIHARQMLGTLSGTTHHVITGVAVIRQSRDFSKIECVTSTVHMRKLEPAEMDKYVQSGDWQGKAGGYGIQLAEPFVTRIEGCQTNIIGLPMTTARKLMSEAGIMNQP